MLMPIRFKINTVPIPTKYLFFNSLTNTDPEVFHSKNPDPKLKSYPVASLLKGQIDLVVHSKLLEAERVSLYSSRI